MDAREDITKAQTSWPAGALPLATTALLWFVQSQLQQSPLSPLAPRLSLWLLLRGALDTACSLKLFHLEDQTGKTKF